MRASSEVRQMTSFKQYTDHEIRRPGLYRKETTDISVQSSSTRLSSRSLLKRDLSLTRDPSL